MVIDGLRFPLDHACLVEAFGNNFFHLHVTASKASRKKRYRWQESEGEFEAAAAAGVEKKVQSVKALAHAMFENEGSISQLEQYVEQHLLLIEAA